MGKVYVACSLIEVSLFDTQAYDLKRENDYIVFILDEYQQFWLTLVDVPNEVARIEINANQNQVLLK